MILDRDKYLVKLSHCIFIDGYKRSIVYDIGRTGFKVIPYSLSQIVNRYNGKKLERLYESYGEENSEILDDYFHFLIENEFIFLSDHLEDSKRFVPLNLEYDTFGAIHNAIIDIKDISDTNLKNNILELESLNCQYIQVRIHNTIAYENIVSIISQFEETQFKNVDIITPYYPEANTFDFELLLLTYQRLGNLIFYNSPIDNCKDYLKGLSTVHFVSYDYIDKKYCGAINSNFFIPNQPLFIESQHYNTCLNRKICINADGNIKNCPAMKASFGNIRETTIEEAVNKPGFKNLWGIRKDDVDVCKDCEFRYMCTDCRCFIKNPLDIYSQPAKCGYNPYIAKWSNEEGYITIEEWRNQNPNWEKKAKRKPLVKVPQKVE